MLHVACWQFNCQSAETAPDLRRPNDWRKRWDLVSRRNVSSEEAALAHATDKRNCMDCLQCRHCENPPRWSNDCTCRTAPGGCRPSDQASWHWLWVQPPLWNSLPVQLRNPDITYGLFRWQLKGHLFRKHEHGALAVTSDMRRIRKTLTFLLIICCHPYTASPFSHSGGRRRWQQKMDLFEWTQVVSGSLSFSIVS